MNTLLIGYDLNKSGQDYTRLIDRIKQYANWCKPVDSTWIIKTSSTCGEVRDDLKSYIDSNDDLIVVKLSGNWASYGLSPTVATWLNTNI